VSPEGNALEHQASSQKHIYVAISVPGSFAYRSQMIELWTDGRPRGVTNAKPETLRPASSPDRRDVQQTIHLDQVPRSRAASRVATGRPGQVRSGSKLAPST
jgi:hypothetical protein